MAELGVGKVLVRKQKFMEDDYTEFELIVTRRRRKFKGSDGETTYWIAAEETARNKISVGA